MPASADIVSSVYIGRAELKDKENIESMISLHRLLLSNRKTNIAPGKHEQIYFEYYLTDGTSVMRSYDIAMDSESGDDAHREAAERVLNCKEAVLFRTCPPEPSGDYTITECTISWYWPDLRGSWSEEILRIEQANAFYEDCLIPDALEGKVGVTFLSDRERTAEFPCRTAGSTAFVYIYFRNEMNGEITRYSPAITTEATRCLTWLSENYGISARNWADYWRTD